MEEKKKNFKRISENRVNKILVLFDQMKNLTNTSFYEYTDDDINKIFNTLQSELDKTKEKLLKNKNKQGKRFEL